LYKYTVYGLSIDSTLALPELQASAHLSADVVIQFGKLNWLPQEVSSEGSYHHITHEKAYCFWDIVGTFLVRNGKEIIIDPLPGVNDRIIRLPLLGAVLAVLLFQRGFLILHSSGIAIDGGVVAFVGAAGWGKSTMAATLYGRGHDMVADDVVALDLSGVGSPVVLPGFPQFKLWPEAATSALGDDPQMLPQLHPQVEKRIRRINNRFVQQPLPLKRIYVLSGGKTPQIEPLQPQEAIAHLIGNSYIAMLSGKQFAQGTKAARHLHQCTNLLERVSIYRLERPRSLLLLPAIAQLVEEDIASDIDNKVPTFASR
jgi:hypothetical protein